MLIIREEQIQHFIAKDDSELVKLIAEIIRTANNERVADYSDETLESMVQIGIERNPELTISTAPKTLPLSSG